MLAGTLRVHCFLLALLLPATSGPLVAQDAPGEALPRVVVLTTGGTIASRPGANLPGDSLVGAVPELRDHARIQVEEIFNTGSSRLTPSHWLTLAHRIDALFTDDPDLAGIVVTHGTDTLDETAFFLNLTVHHRRPVVLVGSMRSADAVSADGPANLIAAVRVAGAPQAAGQGVLVVLNDDIAAARDVQKTHNQRVETFESPELGYLGSVNPDTVLFQRATLRAHTVDSPFQVGGLDSLPRVALVSDVTGSQGRFLEYAVRDGFDGVVVATFAGGRMSQGMGTAVERATGEGVPVVLASRVPGGRIVGDPAEPLGAYLSPDLSPHKARILLMLALTRTREPAGLRRLLRRY